MIRTTARPARPARMLLALALLLACAFHLPAQDADQPAENPARAAAAGDDAGIIGIRHPAISPDGREIAFSWRGDIWIAPIGGGPATRVTDSPACEEHPTWHPNGHGLVLAWTTDRQGTQDIVLGLRTGKELLLTHHGADDCRPVFSPDGQHIYFQSRRDSNLDLSYNLGLWDIWRVNSGGGTPVRITHFRGQTPDVHPAGQIIAFSRYGSGYADGEHDLHIVGANGGVPRSVVSGRPDQRHPHFSNDHLFFVMNANGVAHNTPADNVWGCPATGGAQFQVTDFRTGTITGLDVTAAGDVAVIERDYRLYRVNVADGRVTPIAITVEGNPYAAREQETVDSEISGEVSELVVLDAGAAGAAPSVGFCFGQRIRHAQLDGETTLTIPEVGLPIGQSPQWPDLSPDGRWLAVCEGSAGQQSGSMIAIYDRQGEKPRRVIALASAYRCLDWSPDGTKLAVTRRMEGGGEIREYDVETGQHTIVVPQPENNAIPLYAQYLPVPGAGGAGGSTRLLYVVSTPGGGGYTSSILLLNRETGDTVRLPLEFNGLIRHLQVSPDGTKLAFAVPAGRGADQIVVHDLAAGTSRTLEANASCSYPRWVDSTRIVAAAVARRQQGLALFTLGENGGAGDSVVYRVNRTQPIKRSELQRSTFDAMFGLFVSRFYDPHLHGVDWNGRGNLYRPVAAASMTTRELYDLMSRLILELDSSHVHVELPPIEGPRTGMPGWEVWQLEDGSLKVLDVLPGGPAAQAGIQVGDTIVGCNDTPLGPHTNFNALVSKPIGPSDEPDGEAILRGGGRTPRSQPDPEWTCRLAVRRGDGDEAETRDVTCGLYTRLQIRQLRYDNLIEQRRAFVKERSGGRLAYHHVQTMLQADVNELAQALPAYKQAAEALVLDIRDGIGGNTHHALSQLLDSTARDRLNGRPACYIRERGRRSTPDGVGGPYMRRYRGESWDRPSICVMNNICRSDKEIFPHLYRHLGLGTLVGEPSARGVIGSGYVQLPDGGQCMISSSVFYTADGETMEGSNGVVPDIIVNETLADLYAGRDRQLEMAIDTLLAQLDGKLPFPEKLKADDLPSMQRPAVPRRLMDDGR